MHSKMLKAYLNNYPDIYLKYITHMKNCRLQKVCIQINVFEKERETKETV